MRRALPALLAVVVLVAVLALAGRDAWRTATEQGWLEDGYHGLVRDEFWSRFDVVAPIGLAVLALAGALWAAIRRAVPAWRELRIPLVLVALAGSARLAGSIADGLGAHGPNVLLISIDTLRADRLGTYGYDRPTSPALDARLAARGVVFEHAWSQSPKTTPSHMTMLTSLYPAVHGVPLWEGGGAAPMLNPRVHTLAEILKDAGYATAAYTAGAHMHRDRGFVQGFDEYRHGDQLRRALAFLDTYRRRPFFLFFHTYEVHDPYAPPPEASLAFVTDPVPAIDAAVAQVRAGVGGWPQAHRRFWAPVDGGDPRHVRHVSDLYDAGIRLMDDTTLTALLDALDRLGLADDTLVIFTGDHGEAFHEHGRFLHEDLYPETLRVPLVLRLPGRLPAGRRVAELAGLVDLLPTVLDLLNLPVPSQAQGRSLAALATGATPAGGDAIVLAEFTTAGRRFESARDAAGTVIRDGDTLLAFDRRVDPAERHPVAPEAATFGGLRAALERWHARNLALAARLGPRGVDVAAPSPETVDQLRALGYVE